MKGKPSAAKHFVAVLSVLLQAGQMAAQQTGTLDGQVTDANTGEPVANATLHLIPLRYDRSGNNSQAQANSQIDGAFHFDSVAPGSYAITAERNGFVSNALNSKSPIVSITAGQALTGVAVSLTPEGTISGMIEEEDGTPLPGARVEALAALTTRGQTSLKLYSNTISDSHGKFVLSKLPPNDYYVVAEPASAAKHSNTDGDLVRTIYPRSLDIDGGSAVPLSAGQSVPDITVRVRRTTTFHIRGKIADASTQAIASKLTIAVSPRGSVDSLSLTKNVTVSANQTFDVGGLTPGAYTLRLTGKPTASGRNHTLLARQDVEIGAASLDGVVLSVMPPLTVSGQIHVDASSNSALPRVSVIAKPLEDVSHSVQGFATVANDGSFTFNNLDPGLYLFQAFCGAPGWYVKALTLNQQDILNKEADLSETSTARLDVLMSPGAGEVDVTIQGTNEASGSTIVLVPEIVGPEGSGVLFGYSRQGGSFAFKNVRPGRYFGYATQRGDPDLWQNPEFLQSMQSQGISLEIGENGRQQIQLPLLALEQVEQAAGRIGLQVQ